MFFYEAVTKYWKKRIELRVHLLIPNSRNTNQNFFLNAWNYLHNLVFTFITGFCISQFSLNL